MGRLSRSEASLRFVGDTLYPDTITRQLGQKPSTSERKGDMITNPKTGRIRVARTGGWRLHATPCRPGDLDAQICALFNGLTDDLAVWNTLTQQFHADIFCGLFLADQNEGICLSPPSLQMLAERGVLIDFDIYAHADD